MPQAGLAIYCSLALHDAPFDAAAGRFGSSAMSRRPSAIANLRYLPPIASSRVSSPGSGRRRGAGTCQAQAWRRFTARRPTDDAAGRFGISRMISLGRFDGRCIRHNMAEFRARAEERKGQRNLGRRWPLAISDGMLPPLLCHVQTPRSPGSAGLSLAETGCHLTDLREDIFRGIAIGAVVFLGVALIIGLIGYWFAGPATIGPPN